MESEFSGIERRLGELDTRLARLRSLQTEPRGIFDAEPFLRDVAERNLEVAAQCCIDIANRVIALEGAERPADHHEAIIRMGQLGVLDPHLADDLAPIAGLLNTLVYKPVGLDWDRVYRNLQQLGDLVTFAESIRTWLKAKGNIDD